VSHQSPAHEPDRADAVTGASASRVDVRTWPGPASRTSRIVDGALAAGLAAFLTVGTYLASQGQPDRRPFDAERSAA
jgi:hypothetical protein